MTKRHERDFSFAMAHLEEWRAEYPNHWIAVFDGRLVATESDPDRLLLKLRELGIPAGRPR